MSNTHRGNTQPAIDQEEHAHISNVAGKKVFNIDAAGNIVNFSGVTVYQGDVPWSSLGTTTLASPVTVHQGTSPWVSQATITAYGDQGVPLSQNAETYALKTIDYAHHEIHGGSHFFVKGWQDVASNATISFLFRTPDTTKWAHAQWNIASEAEATFNLYEGVTTAAVGSAVTVYNNDRNSGTAAGILAYSTPSITAYGDNIYSAKTGSGRSVGGGDGREHELIAKQNTDYLFILNSNDGSSTRWIAYDFFWYEHTNK